MALRAAGIRLVQNRHPGPAPQPKPCRPRGRTLRTEIQLHLQAAEFDYDKAFEILDAAPNKDLRYPLLVNRGLLWLERREWDKAVADLQAAIRLDDRQWLAFENLGLVYQQQNNPDQAVEQFTRAIDLRPDTGFRSTASAAAGEPGPQGSRHPPQRRLRALADLAKAIRLEHPGSPMLAQDYTSAGQAAAFREAARGRRTGRVRGGPEGQPGLPRCPSAPRVEVHRSLKRH